MVKWVHQMVSRTGTTWGRVETEEIEGNVVIRLKFDPDLVEHARDAGFDTYVRQEGERQFWTTYGSVVLHASDSQDPQVVEGLKAFMSAVGRNPFAAEADPFVPDRYDLVEEVAGVVAARKAGGPEDRYSEEARGFADTLGRSTTSPWEIRDYLYVEGDRFTVRSLVRILPL